ncbi:non-homologous end-joining DNA ligase [Geodermatophilus chilensis]|uniref:non-homologous end-joining DNA ligase n=1 Tax=Geodermatophilus chilensis TaxID=2035835 RepID=UPI000C25DEC4|nr:non-homologous end-joining DNA ligase [Geodermatophilus chilensis]
MPARGSARRTSPPAGEPFAVTECPSGLELRLERDGVPWCWALPEGPPTGRGPALPAVPTTGGTATGTRPWDSGRYAVEEWREDRVVVALAGRRLRGRHVLFRGADGGWWVRALDAPAEGPPLAPMLATPGELPPPAQDDAWGYEFKWDGVRAVAVVEAGALTLWARSGTDISVRYPELSRLPEALAGHDAIVDGEVVALDARGRPDFGALQGRMHRTGPEVRRMAAAAPVTYLVFDLLQWDGESLLGLPYAQRRERLEALGVAGERWVPTPWFRGGGAAVLAASRDNGLEGIVAKRLDSPYRPGLRGPDWRKVKNVRTQAVVVGGWRPGQGRRAGGVGSLLVGVHDDAGRLVYAGHVGTGFTAAALKELEPLFTPADRAPFADALPREVTRDAHWVEPELVGEVAFAAWTADGRMRHPSWRGLRDDLVPEDVVEEW